MKISREVQYFPHVHFDIWEFFDFLLQPNLDGVFLMKLYALAEYNNVIRKLFAELTFV